MSIDIAVVGGGARRRQEEGAPTRVRAGLWLLGSQLTCGLCRTHCLCCQHCGDSGEARRDRAVAEVEAGATPS